MVKSQATGRKLPAAVLAVVAAAAALAAVYFLSQPEPADRTRTPSPGGRQIAGDADYVDPSACAGCHAEIAASYAETGMGRSFYAATPAAMAHLEADAAFDHEASGRSYEFLERGGVWYLRRSEDGAGNVVEMSIDYVMGSGNHARSYLHQYANGKLVELPVGWYAEQGGFVAMSPGYDQPHHGGFRREISADCFACHNSYPTIEPGADARGRDPLFPGKLPEGIDCQRCHGPARAHLAAIADGAAEAEIRSAVFNPGRERRERQLEVCMQCHLESTSRRLPYSLPRFDRGAFSYRPHQPLADFVLHFDHPSGVREDKYEIAHAAYRLRKSACFSQSEMTCTTCHDPHSAVRGDEARGHYAAACRGCHDSGSLSAHAEHRDATECQSCHMPPRRTDDVVHVVMTDHFIQRRPSVRDPLAPLPETHESPSETYRGPVALYYPERLADSPDNALYLATAQVFQGADLVAGTDRLRSLVEAHKPLQADFYFHLAEAYWQQGLRKEALPWYAEALQRDPQHLIALRNYAVALESNGRLAQARTVIEDALAIAPNDPKSLTTLGHIFVSAGEPAASVAALNRALDADPDSPEASHNLARAHRAAGNVSQALDSARQAIRIRPDFVEARNTLGNLYLGPERFEEAAEQFQQALAIDPGYADAHYNYASALVGLERFIQAEQELRRAVELDPQMAPAHNNLGNLLGMRGDPRGAEQSFRRAIEADPDYADAYFNLGSALAAQNRLQQSRESLEKALEIRPDYQQARLNLALVLHAAGDADAADRQADLLTDPALRQQADELLR